MAETTAVDEAPTPSAASKKYRELEERTLQFARGVRTFVRKLPRSMMGSDDIQQLIRASGAIGVNYIEANEAPDRRDFMLWLRLCLKEAKQSHFWLRLLDAGKNERFQAEKERLSEEALILLRIFCSSLATIHNKRKVAAAAS